MIEMRDIQLMLKSIIKGFKTVTCNLFSYLLPELEFLQLCPYAWKGWRKILCTTSFETLIFLKHLRFDINLD
jgi:hypothetical protein